MYLQLRRALLAAAAIASAGFSTAQSDSAPEIPDALSLETTLNFALEHNFDIRQALESIREQEGLIVEIKARALPSLSVNANYTQLDEGLTDTNSAFAIEPSDNTWGITLSARQALYEGGGIKAALTAQDKAREASLLALETAILDALLEVRTRYFAALLARDQIEVEKQNIDLLEQTLENARLRREAGDVSDFEVLRSEVLLANAQPALIRRQGDFRVAIEQLRQSMGYQNYRRDSHSLTKIPELTDELVYQPFDYDLEESLDQALEHRAELKRLEALTEARKAGVTIAKSGGLPQVGLVGSYGKQKSNYSDDWDDAPEGWTLGVEASWNIWDGNRTRGQRLQAKSQLDQAILQEQSTRLAIEVQVRQAISDLLEADQLAKAANKVVEQAQVALEMADNRFASGTISQLDVLEARVALTEARTNALAANYQHLVAKARYQRAIGQESISRTAWPEAD